MATPVDYGTFTITATAAKLFTFADAGHPSTLPTGGDSFMGKLQTAPVRVRYDGAVPTASEGELIDIGDVVILSANMINNCDVRCTGSTSAKLKGHFYRDNAEALVGGPR